jgi:tetratricopeptide (TPR) repeat protein
MLHTGRWRIVSILPLLIGLLMGFALAPAATAQPAGGPSVLPDALGTVDSLRRAGAFPEARARLRALREDHSGEVAVLWRLVYTLADLGQATEQPDARTRYYSRALQAAKAALAADSTSGHAHLAMAVAEGRAALDAGTRERIERSRAVKRHADRAIALDSTLDGAYHVRGRWHREVEDIGFFKRAIVRTVYGGLPESSIEQAVRDFEQAIALHDEVFHRLELGKTYLQMDRPAAARRALRAALEMPSEGPFDPAYKAEARERLDDLD